MPSRLERLISIEQQINQQRYPGVEELCQMFAVKPRTIFEDIRLLKQRMGLNIEFDRSKNGYFNADPNNKLPPFELSTDEFNALLLAAEMLLASRKVTQGVVESALSKITSRLPVHLVNQYVDMRNGARCAVQGKEFC